MVHAHKEIKVLSSRQYPTWHHADIVRFSDENIADWILEEIEEIRSGTVVTPTLWPEPTVMTELDYKFFGPIPDARKICLSDTDLLHFRLRWNNSLPKGKSFEYTFGCWPWDYLDAFIDPASYKELINKYQVKNVRLYLWVE